MTSKAFLLRIRLRKKHEKKTWDYWMLEVG
jgi:hypothetical protein